MTGRQERASRFTFMKKIKIKKKDGRHCFVVLFFFFSRLGCWPWPLLPLFIYSRAPRAALYHYEQFNLPSAYPLPSPLLLILLQINDRAVCVCVCVCAALQSNNNTHEPQQSKRKKKRKKKRKEKTSAAPCSAPAPCSPPTSPILKRESSSFIHHTTDHLFSLLLDYPKSIVFPHQRRYP